MNWVACCAAGASGWRLPQLAFPRPAVSGVPLWDSGAVAQHREDHKTIHHPEVGVITLDCDVLTIHGSDLRLFVLTAEPGSSDADRLAVVNVIGPQDMDPASGEPAVYAAPAATALPWRSGEAGQ